MDFDFDSLYCNEEDLDCDIGSQNGFDDYNQNVGNLTGSGDELLSLFSKEKEPFLGYNELISNGFTRDYRKIAVERILGVVSYDGFSVLAMNYFDRYISSVCFQREKPWMTRLLAYCLSLSSCRSGGDSCPSLVGPASWGIQVYFRSENDYENGADGSLCS